VLNPAQQFSIAYCMIEDAAIAEPMTLHPESIALKLTGQKGNDLIDSAGQSNSRSDLTKGFHEKAWTPRERICPLASSNR
jgi:hypothetical protein